MQLVVALRLGRRLELLVGLHRRLSSRVRSRARSRRSARSARRGGARRAPVLRAARRAGRARPCHGRCPCATRRACAPPSATLPERVLVLRDQLVAAVDVRLGQEREQDRVAPLRAHPPQRARGHPPRPAPPTAAGATAATRRGQPRRRGAVRAARSGRVLSDHGSESGLRLLAQPHDRRHPELPSTTSSRSSSPCAAHRAATQQVIDGVVRGLAGAGDHPRELIDRRAHDPAGEQVLRASENSALGASCSSARATSHRASASDPASLATRKPRCVADRREIVRAGLRPRAVGKQLALGSASSWSHNHSSACSGIAARSSGTNPMNRSAHNCTATPSRAAPCCENTRSRSPARSVKLRADPQARSPPGSAQAARARRRLGQPIRTPPRAASTAACRSASVGRL